MGPRLPTMFFSPQQKPPEPQAEPEPDIEEHLAPLEAHVLFRARNLLALGFTVEQTLVLMLKPDITHDAEALVNHGCAVDIAFDILS